MLLGMNNLTSGVVKESIVVAAIIDGVESRPNSGNLRSLYILLLCDGYIQGVPCPPPAADWGPHYGAVTLMLLVANLANTKWCKKLKNDWNPGTWLLIWGDWLRAFQWIPTRQGLDGFQSLLHSCALKKNILCNLRIKQHPTVVQYSVMASLTL